MTTHIIGLLIIKMLFCVDDRGQGGDWARVPNKHRLQRKSWRRVQKKLPWLSIRQMINKLFQFYLTLYTGSHWIPLESPSYVARDCEPYLSDLNISGFAQLIHSPNKWVVEPMQVETRPNQNYFSSDLFDLLGDDNPCCSDWHAQQELQHQWRSGVTAVFFATNGQNYFQKACCDDLSSFWNLLPRSWTTWPTWRAGWVHWSSALAGLTLIVRFSSDLKVELLEVGWVGLTSVTSYFDENWTSQKNLAATG